MLRLWPVPFLLITLCAFTGCVSTRAIPYETTTRAAKPPDSPMDIVESGHLSRPYKVIGVVQANAGKLHSVKDTLKRLRDAARKMGGDALMDLEQGQAKIESRGPGRGYSFEDSLREMWSAKVIIWTDGDSQTGDP